MTLLSEMIEAKQKFQEAHGGKPLRDPDSGQDVYPDGTTRIFSDVWNAYEIYEPVAPGEKLRAKRKYVALKLKLEQADFKRFKDDCISRTAPPSGAYVSLINVPAPHPQAKEMLEAGAKRIQALQEELNQLDREIAQLPDEVAKREYLEEQRQRALFNRQAALDIQGVTY